MKKLRCNWRSIAVAACASALASILIVAVGPGFSSPNDNASDTATEATEQAANTEVESSTEAETTEVETTEVTTTSASSTQVPHSEAGNSTASSTPDTHGHIGSGTGTSTGSQADPGHKEDTNGTDGKSNGPGTGDTAASECTNDKHQGADEPQGGANENPGPYDNTCDGRISQNGQGDDAPGGGTPCAGCVGNADDKNPPGQVREHNGQKPNDMGYECDGNQGVGAHYGHGNPAHTGDCAPAPTTCPTNSERNAGMPIPAGQTAETFCKNPPDCPTDMNPFEDGKQCTPPPCPTDMDTETPGLQCVAPTTVNVCHKTGNGYTIHTVRADKIAQWLATHPDDIYPVPANGVAGCVEPPECPTDMDEDKPGLQCQPPAKVDICHATGSATNPYVILSLPAAGLANHLANHSGDIYPVPPTGVAGCVRPPVCPTDMDDVLPGVQCVAPTMVQVCHKSGSTYTIQEVRADQLAQFLAANPEDKYPVPSTGVAGCATAPPPPDCTGDTNPNNNQSCLPIVCPQDSDMPGAPIPGGDVRNCFITPPVVCPSDSNMPGLPVPGGDVRNCYILPPPPLCPVGSDKEGQPMPGGDIRRCYNQTPPPTDVCPAGTDLAGQPMPDGDIRNCNDDVLGEIIDREKPKPDVLGNRDGAAERPGTRGRVLPFTGASILAYLVLALEMLGAGALLMRARKRR